MVPVPPGGARLVSGVQGPAWTLVETVKWALVASQGVPAAAVAVSTQPQKLPSESMLIELVEPSTPSETTPPPKPASTGVSIVPGASLAARPVTNRDMFWNVPSPDSV